MATGSDLDVEAHRLVSLLTPPERLRLLAGDLDFYRDLVLGFAQAQSQRAGRLPLWSAAAVSRLGLPGLHFVDGPRGVARGIATCFPVAIARAASFDYQLEERIGEAIGREARAVGANVVLAPCLNLLRHPGWGRAQETYGEDSWHIGEMGAAFVRGLQRHVLGCAKHFACNSIEESRFKVDVRVDPEVLETVYLPHFKRVVDEGVAVIMSAYNAVNGEWCGQNRYLLTTILKERWGFQGFVVSDWLFGIRDGVAALQAGLDLEMPCRIFIGDRVQEALTAGVLPQERIDDAAFRLVRAQLRARAAGNRTAASERDPAMGCEHDLAAAGEGDRDTAEKGGRSTALPGEPRYNSEMLACPEHRALAREAAVKGIVLLRNEAVPPPPACGHSRDPGAAEARPLLPLDPRTLRSLAVIGRLAAVPNTGDRGSSRVTPPYVVTPLAGLRAALEPLGCAVQYDDGQQPLRAARLAAAADATVVVAGYDYRDEGEYLGDFPPPAFKRLLPRPRLALVPRLLLAALRLRTGGLFSADPPLAGGGDRRSLTLHPEDEELIRQTAAVNPRTVVVVMCGSAVIMERWCHLVPALLILWYPGMEGGHALADVLLGRCRPTGRLPVTIPTDADHLPPFDPEASVVEYGPLHGQAWLDHLGVEPAYPYGFGLTYRQP